MIVATHVGRTLDLINDYTLHVKYCLTIIVQEHDMHELFILYILNTILKQAAV